jgi:hypothetical protein
MLPYPPLPLPQVCRLLANILEPLLDLLAIEEQHPDPAVRALAVRILDEHQDAADAELEQLGFHLKAHRLRGIAGKSPTATPDAIDFGLYYFPDPPRASSWRDRWPVPG